jgi:hypothetical protein
MHDKDIQCVSPEDGKESLCSHNMSLATALARPNSRGGGVGFASMNLNGMQGTHLVDRPRATVLGVTIPICLFPYVVSVLANDTVSPR